MRYYLQCRNLYRGKWYNISSRNTVYQSDEEAMDDLKEVMKNMRIHYPEDQYRIISKERREVFRI